MKDADFGQEEMNEGAVLKRLAEVSAMLHDERGDRSELIKERADLVEQARRLGLLGDGPSAKAARDRAEPY
jgi:hypothetical protein